VGNQHWFSHRDLPAQILPMVSAATCEDKRETRKPSVTKKTDAEILVDELARTLDMKAERRTGQQRNLGLKKENRAGVSSPVVLCCHRPKQNCTGHEAGARIRNTPSRRHQIHKPYPRHVTARPRKAPGDGGRKHEQKNE
jgi:hypothetical protein